MYKPTGHCLIKNNHYLEKACVFQSSINGSKCFKNKCYPIYDILSDKNKYGDVVRIKIKTGKFVVIKWNKKKLDINKWISEISFQLAIYKTLYLCPKILDYYVYGEKIFIVMEDLLSKGFLPYSELKNKYLDIAREKINKTLIQLNDNGFFHGDTHHKNVFYNPKTGKVKFIDFGKSRMIEKDDGYERLR